MGQCMIAMVRKYAPNALVGLQASAWNIAGNTSSSIDVTADAKAVATVLAACGQSKADFVVVETSDRDAGYYQIVESKDTWWDPTDTKLPDYAQDLTWIKALTEALGVPALYWQTPLGNSMQDNTNEPLQGQPRRLLLRGERVAGRERRGRDRPLALERARGGARRRRRVRRRRGRPDRPGHRRRATSRPRRRRTSRRAGRRFARRRGRVRRLSLRRAPGHTPGLLLNVHRDRLAPILGTSLGDRTMANQVRRSAAWNR